MKRIMLGILSLVACSSMAIAAPGDNADISITKIADDTDGVTVGQQVTYLLTITNNGPDASGTITVTDTIPSSSMTFVSASTSQGLCSGTETVTCTLTSLANGASATINITYQVATTGLIINSATTALSDTTDPVEANNTAAYSLVSRTAAGGCSLVPKL